MPILTTSGGGEHAVVAAATIRFIQLLLADRSSLRGHPALVNLGAYGAGAMGSGSMVKQFTLFGLNGYDTMSAIGEGTAATETALATAVRTITLARRGIFRNLSDIIQAVDPTGALNIPVLAMDGFQTAMTTLTMLIATQGDDWSDQVGSTGVDFDHDTLLDAKGAMIDKKVPGPYLCTMFPTHFSSWTRDLESRGGITQWSAANAQMQLLRGSGFQGVYDNIEIWTSDKCPASGGDRVSQLFGRGGIGYAEQEITMPQSAFVVMQEGPIAVEEIRDGKAGLTGTMAHYHVGVVEIQDEAGVGMLAAE